MYQIGAIHEGSGSSTVTESDALLGWLLTPHSDLQMVLIRVGKNHMTDFLHEVVRYLFVLEHLAHFLRIAPFQRSELYLFVLIQRVELHVVQIAFEGVFSETDYLFWLGQPVHLEGQKMQKSTQEGGDVLHLYVFVDFPKDLQTEEREEEHELGRVSFSEVLCDFKHHKNHDEDFCLQVLRGENSDNEQSMKKLFDKEGSPSHPKHKKISIFGLQYPSISL